MQPNLTPISNATDAAQWESFVEIGFEQIKELLRTAKGRALLQALQQIYELKKKAHRTREEILAKQFKTLSKHWKELKKGERRVLLHQLLNLTLLDEEEREWFDQNFGTDVTIDGNTAIFGAPRKPGGIVGIKIYAGITGKYNYQKIALPSDSLSRYNLLEHFEDQQDKKLGTEKEMLTRSKTPQLKPPA